MRNNTTLKIMKALFIGLILIHSSYSFAFTKELGIGDQGVAYPQTSIEGRYNPAGITDVGNRFDITVGTFYQNGRTSIKDSLFPAFNQSKSNTQAKWMPLAVFGIAKQLPRNIAVALSMDFTRSFKSSSNGGFAAFGEGRAGAEFIAPIFLPVVAWKVNRCHSLGIAVPIVIVRAQNKGFQNFALRSESPDHVSNKGYDYAYGFSLRFGWLWHATPKLNIGVSYTPPLIAASHFHKYKGLIPKKGLLEVPALLKAGFAYKITPKANFTFEFEYDFNKHARTLSNSPDSTALFGSKKGPAFGWKNVAQWKFGADYRIIEPLTIRAGWTFLSPLYVKKSNANGNVPDPQFVYRHFINFGATWDYNCWEFGFAYGRTLYRKVRGHSTPNLFGGHIVLTHATDFFFLSVAKKF